MVSLEAVTYPVNDTSLSAAERAYLQTLQDAADKQDLSQDLRPELRNLSIAFTILAALVVALRFLARHRQRAPYGVDDWLILVSLALLGANLAFNLVMLHQGLGLHSGALTEAQLEVLNQTVVGAEVIYTSGVNMYKIALLFLYFRIFPLPIIRKWCYVCGAISTAWNIACIFAAAFQCNPRNKIWEPWVDGYCINLFLAQLCISVPSILCDIAILCIPLPHILRLKTNLTQKIFVSLFSFSSCLVVVMVLTNTPFFSSKLVIIFMLGSYVVFTSIYRFVVYLSYSSDDVPYTLAVPCAWNVIEISSGIVSSCLPTLVFTPPNQSSSFLSFCRCLDFFNVLQLTNNNFSHKHRAQSSAPSSNPSCPPPSAAPQATSPTAPTRNAPAAATTTAATPVSSPSAAVAAAEPTK